MIPVMQTRLSPPDGNCQEACIASIFEIPLELVPSYKDVDWNHRYADWFAQFNIGYVILNAVDLEGNDVKPTGFSILAAQSPRHDCHHAVVCFNGNVVHDPYPDGGLKIGERKYYDIFYLLDPSKPITIGDLRNKPEASQ
jgi:hypothetical protein